MSPTNQNGVKQIEQSVSRVIWMEDDVQHPPLIVGTKNVKYVSTHLQYEEEHDYYISTKTYCDLTKTIFCKLRNG